MTDKTDKLNGMVWAIKDVVMAEILKDCQRDSSDYELATRRAAEVVRLMPNQSIGIEALVRDAERYQKIRAGRSDWHGDVYAMIFAEDGDYPQSGNDLDDIVDVMKPIAVKYL